MITETAGTHRPRGHTLWEVLLVLAVLGAVSALAAPTVRLVRPVTEDVAQITNEIAALLENARLTALRRGTTVEVSLDPSTGRAWVFAAEGDTLQLISTPTLTHLSGVQLLDGGEQRARFVFTPDGQSFGRVVTMRGVGGIRRIAVDPWTGGARVTR